MNNTSLFIYFLHSLIIPINIFLSTTPPFRAKIETFPVVYRVKELAAQCTDAGVNRVTPALFARFPDPAALAEAPLAEVEALIHSTGFFRAKAHNITALSRQLLDRHGGGVPQTMEELTALPGVGRKTARANGSSRPIEPKVRTMRFSA
jgi:endonuclease III